MFNIFSRFKRRENSENIPEQTGDINKVVNDFVELIAGVYRPGMIYDISVLPYKKEHIKEACLLWMQNNKGTEMAENWVSLFPMLSRFQEGIGPEPAGIDYFNIDLNDDETEKLLQEQKGLSAKLSKRVESEHIELHDLACKALE